MYAYVETASGGRGMYDSAITVRTLRGVLRRSDFVRNPQLRNDRTKLAVLRLAWRHTTSPTHREPTRRPASCGFLEGEQFHR
jgi:hypothetical protein